MHTYVLSDRFTSVCWFLICVTVPSFCMRLVFSQTTRLLQVVAPSGPHARPLRTLPTRAHRLALRPVTSSPAQTDDRLARRLPRFGSLGQQAAGSCPEQEFRAKGTQIFFRYFVFFSPNFAQISPNFAMKSNIHHKNNTAKLSEIYT